MTSASLPSTAVDTDETPADRLRSLSQVLLQLARDQDERNLRHGHGAGKGGGSAPSLTELVHRVECAVHNLVAATFGSRYTVGDRHDNGKELPNTPTLVGSALGPGLDSLETHVDAQGDRTMQDPRSQSVTPRPPSSRPISPFTMPSSPSPPTLRAGLYASSASPCTLPETPVRAPPSTADLALERSLASLSIDASAVDATNGQHADPTSPSITAAAAAAASKSKLTFTRTSSQLTPVSVHPTKRSRQSMTPLSRPRFSLGVYSSTASVAFVRTPFAVASPTRQQPLAPPSTPGHLLVPECTSPRPLSPIRIGNRSRRHSRRLLPRSSASPVPIPANGLTQDDDDDAVVLVSSTPVPISRTPPSSTAKRTVVILTDSEPDSPLVPPPPPSTIRRARPARPTIHLPSSSSSSDSDSPATPTRRPLARHPTPTTPRSTPKRTGGTIQKKLELLRDRFTPRRDVGSPASGIGARARRAAVVVESDDDDGEDQSGLGAEHSEDDAGGSEFEEVAEGGRWSGVEDENEYDSSFIDDGDANGDEQSDHDRGPVPTPKRRAVEIPEMPKARHPTPATPLTTAAFARNRVALTAKAFAEFNTRAFDNQLPDNLRIEWNKRLCTTAGRAWPRRFKPSADRPVPPGVQVTDDGWVYDARVELSVKVLDSEEKLRRTLLHELCHVAAWLIDHVAKPPHGPRFRHWAKKATHAFPHLQVTTCHDYEIHFKYKYTCTQCGHSFGRHSKSVDVDKKACGVCQGGRLEVARMVPSGGKGSSRQDEARAAPRAMSAYQVFVKENYAQVKQGGRLHKEVMGVLSEMWAIKGKKKASIGAGNGVLGELADAGGDDHEDGVVAAE